MLLKSAGLGFQYKFYPLMCHHLHKFLKQDWPADFQVPAAKAIFQISQSRPMQIQKFQGNDTAKYQYPQNFYRRL